MVAEEGWLEDCVRKWDAAAPLQGINDSTAIQLERRILRTFKQHVAADHAWGHLLATHVQAHRYEDAQRLMARRVAFKAAAYPAINLAHAWTLDAQADLLLLHLGVRVDALVQFLSTGRTTHGSLDVLLNNDIGQQIMTDVLPIHASALKILRGALGPTHEYTIEVVRKAAGLQRALASFQPGIVSKEQMEPVHW